MKDKLIDSGSNMYLLVNSLIDRNTIISGSNDILRRFNGKQNRYDKMYMDQDLIEDKLLELIDQFTERKMNLKDFYFALLNNIHGRNGRTCKILFVTNFS